MDEHLRRIIKAGIYAPSGENAQPWRFHAESNSIELREDPGSDASLYNLGRRGTLIAMGAAIENMVHAAGSLGYELSIHAFPSGFDDTIIARLTIKKGSHKTGGSTLARAIRARVTNRKPFRTDPLTDEDSSALVNAADYFSNGGVRLVRVTDVPSIGRLAVVGSTNERVMLGNRELHSFFFGHLTWSKEEDDRVKRGFYIKTLELPMPLEKLFGIFRFWLLMRALKLIGFTALVGKGNAQTYAATGEIGLITIPGDTPENFLTAGRAFERIWLTATSRGLALQPLTGTIYLGYALREAASHFSAREQTLIARQIKIVQEFSGGGTIAIMYRVGYPKSPPSARASRFPVDSLLV
ncbi:MAG: hypothetical protein Q8P19_02200 [bacterium]|nr:hypothetical protein [bacterium]